MSRWKTCACPRAQHQHRYTKGECTAEVVHNHVTGWCFMCMADCAGPLRRFWWWMTGRG